MWKYFRVFFTRQVMVACAKIIGFLSKFQSQSFGHLKVNNLATFLANILEKCGQVIDLEIFTCFFVKICFVKTFILPAERRRILKKKQTTKNNKIKVAKLLTYGGQVIDPTAYIHIYI